MASSNTGEIKSRMVSVGETKKVTDAMYMISSVKMRKAKNEVKNTEPYFKALKFEISKLIACFPETVNRYFHSPLSKGKIHGVHGILLVTSDRGLAGSYNSTAIKVAEEYMGRHPETVLFIVGEYGRQYFSGKKIPFERGFDYAASFPSVTEARKMCFDLLECFDSGRVDDINIIYTAYKGSNHSECKRNYLLPLDKSRFDEYVRDDGKTVEYYPNADTVLSGIVPSYLTGFIYSCLTDSYCSEQEARMTAMSSAGNNADEMLRKLKMKYNSIRQASITREMIEITAGAKALRAKREKQKEGMVDEHD